MRVAMTFGVPQLLAEALSGVAVRSVRPRAPR